ncbi:unnamed protein product, partial [Scytosiphon promiscuus]
MDQVELEIYRVHGLTDKTDNRGSVWIKFDLGYSKDEKIGKGFTQSYRSDHDTVNMDYKTSCYVKRARSTQMAFQNRRTGLEIFHKKNIVRSVAYREVSRAAAAAADDVRAYRVHPDPDGGTERGRGQRGDDPPAAQAHLEKEIEVGEWPAVSLDPVVQTPAPAPAVAPAAAAAATPTTLSPCARCPGCTTRAVWRIARGMPRLVPLHRRAITPRMEKNDPFAVENLDSNNVLEAEIEAVTAKAASGDLASVMRKGALETKLLV